MLLWFLARVPEPQVVPVMSAGIWMTKMVESGEALADGILDEAERQSADQRLHT
jgi:hypothetical protein